MRKTTTLTLKASCKAKLPSIFRFILVCLVFFGVFGVFSPVDKAKAENKSFEFNCPGGGYMCNGHLPYTDLIPPEGNLYFYCEGVEENELMYLYDDYYGYSYCRAHKVNDYLNVISLYNYNLHILKAIGFYSHINPCGNYITVYNYNPELISIENVKPIGQVYDGEYGFFEAKIGNVRTTLSIPMAEITVYYWKKNYQDQGVYSDTKSFLLIAPPPGEYQTVFVDKTTLLPHELYQFYYELKIGGVVRATSPTYDFEIVDAPPPTPEPSPPPYPTTSPTISPPPYVGQIETVCTPPEGGFLEYPVQNMQYALCKAITALFIPSQQQLDNVSEYLDSWIANLKTKPPFGYFYLVKDSLANIELATPLTEYNFTIPVINNTLRNGLKFCFWFLAVIYLAVRIKTIL